MTLMNLVNELAADFNLTAEQQYLMAAKIKRHVHEEKCSVHQRFAICFPDKSELYPSRNLWVRFRRWAAREEIESLERFIKRIEEQHVEKMETHATWSEKPDHEVITWDMGQDKFDYFVMGIKQ